MADDQTRRVLTYEPEMRAVLRLSLEAQPPVSLGLPMNRGLRIGWIEDALAPLRGDARRRAAAPRLRHRATLGIEAFVWLTDIARLPREDALATIRANALAILRSALAELPGAQPA